MTDLPSFLDGVPAEAAAALLARLDRRHFLAGAAVVSEGEVLHGLYIIASGSAEIFIADPKNIEHRIGHAGPGAALGEMALFTGQPASASVYAATDLDVVVLSHRDFHQLAGQYPVVYSNLGMMLSERLSRSNRMILRNAAGGVTMLLDRGAPPVLGYALACSLTWHTRRATLLVVLTDDPRPELVALAGAGEPTAWISQEIATQTLAGDRNDAVTLVITAPKGRFASEHLVATVEDLRHLYGHVLIQARPDVLVVPIGEHRLDLVPYDGEVHGQSAAQADFTLCGWSDSKGYPYPDEHHLLAVPALTTADEQALRDGTLPAASPAGQALGWMARHLAGLKVGLALGAGSFKGYAHVGVLQSLRRAGVAPDYVAGTSVGAAVAALHAFAYSPEAAADVLDTATAAAFRLTVPLTALLSNRGLRSRLRELAGDWRIEDASLPLAVTAADILSGREFVFRRGPVWRAVLASMAMPGIYPPQRVGSHLFVDGGVLQPVPSRAVADMGADIVIGVKLATVPSSPETYRGKARARTRMPSVLGVISRSIDMMQSRIATETAALATIVIEPIFKDDPGWGLRNFGEGRRFIELGEIATEAALPRIADKLPWVSG